MHAAWDELLAEVVFACRAHYGSRLRAVAVFGSVGRETPRADSDVDLLVVADLPDGRMARVDDFRSVERAAAGGLREARAAGLAPTLSPVFKTPAELDQGSLLLLDMTQDGRVLYDPDELLTGTLTRLEQRLAALGARRIWIGNAWIWDLKPDYQPGEVFEL